MSLCSVLFFLRENRGMGRWGYGFWISKVHAFAVSCCGSPSLLWLFSSSSALVIDTTLLAIDSCNKSWTISLQFRWNAEVILWVQPEYPFASVYMLLQCLYLRTVIVLCPLASMLTMNNTTNQSKWEGFDCHHKSNIWMSWLMSCDSPSQLLDRRECSSFQAGKFVLLCWDVGPASDPWGVATFSRFLAVMNLSLHLKTNLSRARAWESCALGTKELKDPPVFLQEVHGEIHEKHKLINNSSIWRKTMKSRGE